MPFTLSHAAAAIPFRRTPLIMSALVMGCFVPDFHYLVSMSSDAYFGHTIAGMFVLDLPVAIVSLWLFHAFIKLPILIFLPSGFQRRLATSMNSFSFWPAKRFFLIAFSILVGTSTHLLWDAFTHYGTWFFWHLAFLRMRIQLPDTGYMPMWKLMEFGSSVFGLAVTAVWIWHWYRTTRPAARQSVQFVDAARGRTSVTFLAILALLGAILRAYVERGIRLQIRPIVHFSIDMVVSAITFFLIGLLIYGVILRRHKAEHVRV